MVVLAWVGGREAKEREGNLGMLGLLVGYPSSGGGGLGRGGLGGAGGLARTLGEQGGLRGIGRSLAGIRTFGRLSGASREVLGRLGDGDGLGACHGSHYVGNWSPCGFLSKVAVLWAVPPYMTNFTTLETATLPRLMIVSILDILLFFVLLLLHPLMFSPCVPASFGAVLHVMTDLATDPTAPVIRCKFPVREHLGVKEVVRLYARLGVERSTKQLPAVDKGLHDEVSHFARNSSTKIVIQVEGIFDGDALGGPLLLEGGESFPLADANDMLLKVKLLGVEPEQAQPQLPHRLTVLLQLWQMTTQFLEVITEEGIPTIHHPLWYSMSVKDLLENRDDGGLSLLQEVEHHEDVCIG